MALIGMAVYDTEQNKRTEYTKITLRNIFRTVDLVKHRLIVVDNGSCEETRKFLSSFEFTSTPNMAKVIFLDKNIGTAEAINLAWKEREPEEHAVKMDNDIYVHPQDWLDELEEVVNLDPFIGQCALKRTDIWENVYEERDFYRTTLTQLPHQPGKRWIVVENTNHCIGSCVLHSAALLNEIGYLKQPSTYGLDDSLMSARSKLAGFKNVFLPHILIDHLDISPPADWQKEKERVVNESWGEYHRLMKEYAENPKSIYYNPFE